jgi:CheY-like chemotaxis protein
MLKHADNLVAKLRVLIVDDQLETCNFIRRLLLDLGLTQTFTAKSAEEGLQFLNAADDGDAVDLILCDWNMPGMTGIEFLRQIRSADPDLPFIMITGNADKYSVVEARAHGVTGYIAKPFSAAALHTKLNIVAQLLASRRETTPAN